MTHDRSSTLGAGLALLLLVVLIVGDLLVPEDDFTLATMFGLVPLIACAVVSVRGTAVLAGLAVVAAAGSGVWNGNGDTGQQTVRLVNVVLVGAASVVVAVVRVRRERRFEQVAAMAEAAQRAILPVLPAEADGVVIAARYRSAARGGLVGGDLFDCYHSEVHTRILIGDVRGKGIAGVEQAARVIRAFRQSAALRPTLEEVAREMDDYLAGFFDDEEFVTALLAEVGGPHELRLLSAGHPQPLLVPEGGDPRPVELPPGLPLGLGLGGVSGFAAVALAWRPGDRVLLYTDGLNEARDSTGAFLELGALAPALAGTTVESAIEQVLDRVAAHVPRGQLEDDLALVLLENTDQSPSAEVPEIARRSA